MCLVGGMKAMEGRVSVGCLDVRVLVCVCACVFVCVVCVCKCKVPN